LIKPFISNPNAKRITYEGMRIVMNKSTKSKQIVVRFSDHSYDMISEYAEMEHRGLGEFVRHATLIYIEQFYKDAAFTINERKQ